MRYRPVTITSVMTSAVMIWFFAFAFFLCTTAQADEHRIAGSGGASVSAVADDMGGNDFDTFDEFEVQDTKDEVYDPLMGYNRFMTRFNDKAYFWFFKPVGKAYVRVTPEFFRVAVSRFFKNLDYPVNGVNNLLQLKLKRAGIETARFAVNTTVGIAGFFDPAQSWLDLSPCPEDFGQTLGRYGVRPGIPIVLPILGPSNVRDVIGRVPDYFLDPVTYYPPDRTVAFIIKNYGRFNKISFHIGDYEKLKAGAVDWYILMRNAYEQNREKAIGE